MNPPSRQKSLCTVSHDSHVTVFPPLHLYTTERVQLSNSPETKRAPADAVSLATHYNAAQGRTEVLSWTKQHLAATAQLLNMCA